MAPAGAIADPPQYAITVTSCGTLPFTPVVGVPAPLTQDTTGKACTNAASGGGPLSANITQWNSGALGSPTAWGTAPSGNVIGVNAYILSPLGSQTSANSVAVTSSPGSILDLTTTGTPCPTSTTATCRNADVDAAILAAISRGSTTPAAGTAYAIVTGGVPLNIITGPVNGCYVTNPTSATDQNIATAENIYLNPVTAATTTGNGTNVTIAPGQSYSCVPGQTTNLSMIAATTAHAVTVVKW
jgi:hypothetical protein